MSRRQLSAVDATAAIDELLSLVLPPLSVFLPPPLPTRPLSMLLALPLCPSVSSSRTFHGFCFFISSSPICVPPHQNGARTIFRSPAHGTSFHRGASHSENEFMHVCYADHCLSEMLLLPFLLLFSLPPCLALFSPSLPFALPLPLPLLSLSSHLSLHAFLRPSQPGDSNVSRHNHDNTFRAQKFALTTQKGLDRPSCLYLEDWSANASEVVVYLLAKGTT